MHGSRACALLTPCVAAMAAMVGWVSAESSCTAMPIWGSKG